jgi:TonB family protein
MIMSVLPIFLTLVLSLFQEDYPTFKGGKQELEAFFANHIIYPEFSKNNCIEATVFISFKLDKDGNVFDTKVESGPGIDLDEEALRIIKLTNGRWNVPKNNNDRLTIPINFSLKDYACEKRSEEDIKKAIAYYTIRDGLENTVFSYYKNKAIGKANETDEAKIISLKKDLGFDEEFEEARLEEARKMLKQKDLEGACKTLQILKNIGSNKADRLIAENCN